MDIFIASDHAGFELKQYIISSISKISWIDLGCDSLESVDYPIYSFKLAQSVVNKKSSKGIMICGSGVGSCIAANKVLNARASVCHDSYSAHQGVEHDDMNILVLGARVIGKSLAIEVVNSFINAKFSNDERHLRRLKQILSFETKYEK